MLSSNFNDPIAAGGVSNFYLTFLAPPVTAAKKKAASNST
jgi:hypothetical protein